MIKSCLGAAALTSALLLSPMASAAALDGTWLTESGETKVAFAPCGAATCGTIQWQKTPRADTENPDATKRSRPLVGAVMLSDIQADGAGRWKGQLYNIENGKTYSGTLDLQSPERMKLSGCVLGGLVCKSQIWTRVK